MAFDPIDLATRYASARLDQATQPFTDPTGYMNNRLQQDFGVDMNGNVTPKSTTITNNDDGTKTITQKHEVTPETTPAPAAAPAYQLPVGGPPAMMPPAPAMTPPAPAMTPPAPAPEMTPPAPAMTPPAPAPAMTPPAQTSQVQNAGLNNTPLAPVDPNQVMAQAPVPQPGPATQLASNTTGSIATPTTAPQPAPVLTPDEQHQQALIAAHNEPDVNRRQQMFGQLLTAPGVSDEHKMLANEYLARDYLDQKKTREAENKVNGASSTDIARYMKDKSVEGSYVKAILFARLGLADLARQEQERISPSLAMGSEIGADGQRYSVVRDKDGFVTKAFDSTGRAADDAKVAELSASAMATKGNIGHAGATRVRDAAGNEWSVVPTTRGSQFYNNSGQPGVPTGKTVPITVGGDVGLQRDLAISRAQTKLESVKAEDRVRALEDVNKKRIAEGLDPLSTTEVGINERGESVIPTRINTGGAQPTGGAVGTDLNPDLQKKIVSGVRTNDQQQALYDETVRAGRPGVGPTGLPVAPAGTSRHEGGAAIDMPRNLSRTERAELAQKGYYQPEGTDSVHWERLPGAGATAVGTTPTSVSELTRQREEAVKVAAKRGESFNKHVDETITPDAINGDSIANTRKQQFAMFDRPGVDAGKIFGIANGAGSAPGDQRWTMFRDILLGKVSEPEDKIRQRAASLGLNREEQSAVAEYAIANADINSKTLKSTAGPGSISDAEQKINQARNVNPTMVPMLGGYNAMAQSQFNGDLARYKGDWATTSTATNTAQLEKDWRKEKDKLSKMYTDTARDRIKYISEMGNTPAAIKEGYKRYPVPQYDPNTESWIKKKPLTSYDR